MDKDVTKEIIMNKLKIGMVSVILIISFMFMFTGTGTDNIDISNIKDPDLKFIIVGDPHIKAIENNDEGVERLRSIINLINKMDIDFVVFMGDVTDKGTMKQYNLAIKILRDLKKPYYVIIGNHDIMTSNKMFEEYFGSSERIETIKGHNATNYQLLFIGTYADRDDSGNLTNLYWSFDFDKAANKTVPTIIFAHTPIRCPSSVYISCKLNEKILVYGKTMEPEIKKFTNLLGVYSGHIHRESSEIIDGVRYTTVGGLVHMGIAGIYAQPSDNIGYSVIKDGILYYQPISYKVP